jgi:myo-inositol catabolism protein IolC
MTGAQTSGTMAAHAARPLLILAADHRNSLERDLYGLTAAPTPEQAARISTDKMLIYQALLDAVPQLPASAQPGILIDEQCGATIAEQAARAGNAISLAMPVEASGEQWFHYAYGDWQAHAGLFTTDHAKILIRDNPGLEPGQRAAQAERVARVSDWAAANDRALIVELLAPAGAADLDAVGGAVASDDIALRPEHTVQVIEYLQDHGVAPALWGVADLNRHDDAVAIAAVAKRGGRTADCLVLGRHARRDQLDHWLQVAAPIPGFTGFAVGRMIWWDPLHAHLHHRSNAAWTRRRIATAYLDFVRYFLDARDGTLRCGTTPETDLSSPARCQAGTGALRQRPQLRCADSILGVAGGAGGLPDPGSQQDHRGRERQRKQQRDGSPRWQGLGDPKAGYEQDSQPPWDTLAAPQGNPHDDRRGELAEEIDVRGHLGGHGVEAGYQEERGGLRRHVRRRSSRQVDPDQDVEHRAAEGTHTTQ